MAASAIGIREANGTGKILVASSRAGFRASVVRHLFPAAQPSEAAGGAEALIKLEESEFGTLVLDPCIEDLDAEELVATIRRRFPQVEVIVPEEGSDREQLSFDLRAVPPSEETGERYGDPEDAQEELAEYPPETPRDLRAPEMEAEPLPGMIGTSRRMQEIYRLTRLVALYDTTVLVVGATGTGKELIARGIHELSRRSRGPFVAVNCAAIPESLLEAELFGFTRGAFTGAFQSRLGRIHAAHGGTLLLDEVGELPLSMQAKLLRFVQEGEVQRLGSADLLRVDTRLIAATNSDLPRRVHEREFREDLYYRLAVFPIEIPPLRERSEDILPLARHFLQTLCRQSGSSRKTFSLEAATLLRKHPWPGNVRELQHRIERAFVLAGENGVIRAEDLGQMDEMG